MTRQELRVALNEHWFCGCGLPEEAVKEVLAILRLCPLYDNRPAFEARYPNVGVQHLLLYQLTNEDLIEHGGGIGGSWLTDKGEEMLAALECEESDAFETLLDEACVHGYATRTSELLDCPVCGPMNRPKAGLTS